MLETRHQHLFLLGTSRTLGTVGTGTNRTLASIEAFVLLGSSGTKSSIGTGNNLGTNRTVPTSMFLLGRYCTDW